ncbi:MAG: hypothetical protein HC778_00060 [Chamaesiphon sp. CSU_1_12]|nr:hypothetical protein [Chamaesiphon sp. CSU_1_12]
MSSALTNALSAIVAQAAQLPDTGIASRYARRIGTGNPNVCCILLDTSGSMNQKM